VLEDDLGIFLEGQTHRTLVELHFVALDQRGLGEKFRCNKLDVCGLGGLVDGEKQEGKRKKMHPSYETKQWWGWIFTIITSFCSKSILSIRSIER
jgi:hypothetical protein